MCDQQEQLSIYIGHLESHHVALVGDEADSIRSDTSIAKDLSGSTNPNTIETLETVLRHQVKQGYYIAPNTGDAPPNIELHESNKLPTITLLWGKSQHELIADHSATDQVAYHWSLNLSDWSYEDVLLDKTETLDIKLKVGEKEIPLFKAPYLLSTASLGQGQRIRLFSHLDIHLRLCLQPTTGTWVLDLFGDDAKTTHYTFAGWHSEIYQQTMLEHWYEKIAHEICINEPPEVRGSHA